MTSRAPRRTLYDNDGCGGETPVNKGETMHEQTVLVDNRHIHYREAGEGPCVLLLHGWPTSSWLWRDVMPVLAQRHRVIAPDLPGFGLSEKRMEDSFSFRYHERFLNAFLDHLQIEQTDLVVHDLGGPVGVYWALRHPERVHRLGILNTLLYPDFHWTAKAFVLATLVPGFRRLLSHPRALAATIRFGVQNKARITEEVLQPYLAPFSDSRSQRVLLKTASRLALQGFEEIAAALPEFPRPVRIIYGAQDRILPNVAATMERLQHDLPETRVTVLSDAGHFLQEDAGEEVGKLLLDFFQR